MLEKINLDQLGLDVENLEVLDPSDFGIEMVEVPVEEEREEEEEEEGSDLLIKKAEKKEESVLSRIRRFAVYDMQSLLALLQQMRESLRVREPPFYNNLRLIVVDSIATVLSPILGKHAIGHSMMCSLGFLMKEMAKTYDIAFVYTNHLVSSGEGRAEGEAAGAGYLRPALGASWEVTSNSLIFLDRLKTSRGWSAGGGGGGEGGGGGGGALYEATVSKCSHLLPNDADDNSNNTHNAVDNTVRATKYRFTISDMGIEGIDDVSAMEAEAVEEWHRELSAEEDGMMEWEGGEGEGGGGEGTAMMTEGGQPQQDQMMWY